MKATIRLMNMQPLLREEAALKTMICKKRKPKPKKTCIPRKTANHRLEMKQLRK